MYITPETLGLGILVAAGLSALIGVEREIHGQPAGLRTHIMVGTGAALASVVSILFSADWSNEDFGSDPARIVAQVVSGVGFLGAGAIMRFGVSIKGLTTAASLWTTAIIGIAAGAGYYTLAGMTTAIATLTLALIGKAEKWILTPYHNHELKVSLVDRPGIINDLREMLEKKRIKILSMSASVSADKILKLSLIIRMPSELAMDTLFNVVNAVDGAQTLEISTEGE